MALGTEIHLDSAASWAVPEHGFPLAVSVSVMLYCSQPSGWEIGGRVIMVFSGISQTSSENPLYKVDSVMLFPLRKSK